MKDEELREQIIEYLNNDHYNLIVDCSVSILTDIIDAIAGFKSHPPQTEKKSSYPETVDQLRGNRVVTSAPSKSDEVCPKCGDNGRCEPQTLDSPDGQECNHHPPQTDHCNICGFKESLFIMDYGKFCVECIKRYPLIKH